MALKQTQRRLSPLVIEKQETVVEVHTKSTELVRLSRVKYEGNDLVFVDVRVFSGGYDDDNDEKYFPTRRGVQMKESAFAKLIAAQEKPAVRPINARSIH